MARRPPPLLSASLLLLLLMISPWPRRPAPMTAAALSSTAIPHSRHRHHPPHRPPGRQQPQQQRQRRQRHPPPPRGRGGGGGGGVVDHDGGDADVARRRMGEATLVESLLRDANVAVVGLRDRPADDDDDPSPRRAGPLFPSVRQCNSGEPGPRVAFRFVVPSSSALSLLFDLDERSVFACFLLWRYYALIHIPTLPLSLSRLSPPSSSPQRLPPPPSRAKSPRDVRRCRRVPSGAEVVRADEEVGVAFPLLWERVVRRRRSILLLLFFLLFINSLSLLVLLRRSLVRQ